MDSNKLALAVFVVNLIMFLMSVALILNAVMQVKSTGAYSVPEWFVELCRWAVGSGLVVLGFPALMKKSKPPD